MQSLMHFNTFIRLGALLSAVAGAQERCESELDPSSVYEEVILLQPSQDSSLMQVSSTRILPSVAVAEEPAAAPRTPAARAGAGLATPSPTPPPLAAAPGPRLLPRRPAKVAAAVQEAEEPAHLPAWALAPLAYEKQLEAAAGQKPEASGGGAAQPAPAAAQAAAVASGAGVPPAQAAAPARDGRQPEGSGGGASQKGTAPAQDPSEELRREAEEAGQPGVLARLRRRVHRALDAADRCIERARSWLSSTFSSAKPIVPEEREDTAQLIAFALFSMVVQAILGSLLAHAYLDSVRVQPEVDMSKRGFDLSKWSSGFFLDILSDLRICMCACCCPCLRWADSLHTLGIMSFWAAFWLSIACILLTELTYGLFGALLLAGLVYFRHRLRKKFKMESSGYYTYAADFLRYCLCLPCTIAQDARHIEEACRCDHPAVLSGTLLHYDS